MEKSEPPTALGPSSRRLPSRRRLIGSRLFVRTAVILSVLLALVMIVSLYVHWRRAQEPNTYILVIGDPSWNGVEVVVTPADDSQAGGRRVQVVLDDRNNYRTPIFELPGRYRVTVSAHEQLIRQYSVEVDPTRAIQIDLLTPVEVFGDPSLDGGRVLLSSKDDSQSGVLNADNRYRFVFHVQGGEYSLEVTRNGQLLDHAEFIVFPHTPKKVDLRKGS